MAFIYFRSNIFNPILNEDGVNKVNFVSGEKIVFAISDFKADFTNCPGAMSFFSADDVAEIDTVRGQFFTTKAHPALWAPFSAVKGFGSKVP